jgi:NADH-quinone oxidoreductase subunit C
MVKVLHPAPRVAIPASTADDLRNLCGASLIELVEEHGEIIATVTRDSIVDVLRTLRDEHQFQQLMEIAGADYPDRDERFEVVYMLLSVTRNTRMMVKVRAAEDTPVPTVTVLWPNAGWLEREVFDLYGVVFDGNPDLRRILTDYGFEGHPFRKDFPMTGYHELRYSEEEKRVVYEPVELPQEMRTFDFLSPWEGAEYVLPGDEKAEGAAVADAGSKGPPKVDDPKVTEKPSDTGAGAKADAKAADKVSAGAPAEEDGGPAPDAPDPTEDQPARAPREGKNPDTSAATEPDEDGDAR